MDKYTLIAIALIVAVILWVFFTVTAVVDYGQKWDNCRVEHGTWKVFSEQCVK